MTEEQSKPDEDPIDLSQPLPIDYPEGEDDNRTTLNPLGHPAEGGAEGRSSAAAAGGDEEPWTTQSGGGGL